MRSRAAVILALSAALAHDARASGPAPGNGAKAVPPAVRKAPRVLAEPLDFNGALYAGLGSDQRPLPPLTSGGKRGDGRECFGALAPGSTSLSITRPGRGVEDRLTLTAPGVGILREVTENGAGQPMREAIAAVTIPLCGTPVAANPTLVRTMTYDGYNVGRETTTIGDPSAGPTTTIVVRNLYDDAGHNIMAITDWKGNKPPGALTTDELSATTTVTASWHRSADKRAGQDVVTTTTVTGPGLSKPDTRTTLMRSDVFGNLMEQQVGTSPDHLEVVHSYGFDSAGNLYWDQPAGGPTTARSYVVMGQVAKSALTATTPGGGKVTETTYYSYDAEGNQQCMGEPSGVTTYSVRDRLGRVCWQALGAIGNGRCTGRPVGPVATCATKTPPIPGWKPGSKGLDVTAYSYEADRTRPASVTRGFGSADAATWSYTYGAHEELLSVTMPTTTGPATEKPRGHPASSTWRYAYDGELRLIEIRTPDGVDNQAFAYDELGRETRRTRGSMVWVTTYTGSLSTTTDPAGNVVQSIADASGRPVLTLLKTPSDPIKARESGVTTTTPPLLTERYRVRGLDGQLLKAIDYYGSSPARTTVSSSYDPQGRLVERNLTDARAPQPKTVQLKVSGYSPTGDPLQVTVSHDEGRTQTSDVRWTLDTFSRLSRVTDQRSGASTALEWEPGGARIRSLTERGSGTGLSERRCYDDRGWITGITTTTGAAPRSPCGGTVPPKGLQQQLRYSYDGRGNRVSETDTEAGAAPEVTRYGYDPADRLTGVLSADGTAELYALNAEGSRTHVKILPRFTPRSGLQQEEYARAPTPAHWLQFNLDDAGRLRDGQQGSDTIPAVVDLSSAKAGAMWVKTDPAGRVVRLITGKPGSEGQQPSVTRAQAFRWDAAGRMIQATALNPRTLQPDPQAGPLTTYDYDGDGSLTGESDASGATSLFWWQGSLLERLKGSRATAFLHENGVPLWGITRTSPGKESPGDAQRFLHDARGTVRGAWDGSKADFFHADVWGAARTASPAEAPGPGLAGLFSDSASHLFYGKGRWYSPELGSWLSEEVAGATERLSAPGGLNPWVFANGNPVGESPH